MDKTNERIESTSTTTDAPISDFDGLVRVLSRFRLLQCVGASVAFGVALNAANFAAHRLFGFDLADPLGVVCLGAFFGFVPSIGAWFGETIATAQAARITYARAQAEIESLTGRDLNKSGAVGDVVMPEPQVQEVVRVIPFRTAAQLKQIEGLPADDVREFINGLASRGLVRSGWIGYKFQSGRECTREFYDATMNLLTRIGAVEGRGRGSDGRMTRDAVEIIAELG